MPASPGVRSLNYGRPVNGMAPLNAGLSHWWRVLPLLSGGRYWRDLVRQAPGTLTAMLPSTATTGWGSTRRRGGTGELRFDGSTSQVDLAMPFTFVETGAWAWALWIRPVDFTEYRTVFSLFKTSPIQNVTLYAHTTTDTTYGPVTAGLSLELQYLPGGFYMVAHTADNVLTAGQWHHIGVVWDGAQSTANRMSLYVDGIDQTARGDVESVGALGDFTVTQVTLGLDPYASPQWNGALDDVRVYQRRLSADQMRALYVASRQGYPRELNWPILAFSPRAPTTTRLLVATVAGTSRTPSAAGVTVRALTAGLGATTRTPPSTALSTRHLTGTLGGTSQAPAPSARSVRLLTTRLEGASATRAASALLLRRLLTSCAATSTTPSLAQTIQRVLSATSRSTSTTPTVSAAVPSTRLLLARTVGTSRTPVTAVVQTLPMVAGLIGASRTPSALAVTPRHLVTTLTGRSVTPNALSGATRRVSATSRATSVTRPATTPGVTSPNAGFAFSATATWTVLGSQHNLGTPALVLQAYDASTPAQLVEPGLVTVHPTTFDVTATWLQPMSGTLVLNAGHPSPLALPGNFAVPLTAATTVTILGTTHGLGTKQLLVRVYDDSIPAREIHPALVTVHPTTFTVVVTFAQPTSGQVVLSGATGSGGIANYTEPFTLTQLTTIGQPAHGLGTNRIAVEAYDTSTPARRLIPALVTVHPTTYDVIVTWAQPTSGLLVLTGSTTVRRFTAAVAGATGTRAAALSPPRLLTARVQGSVSTRALPIAPGVMNLAVPFTGQTLVSLPGSVHGLGTSALLVGVYSTAVPAVQLEPALVTVHPTTYDVTVTFGQPQSGTLVLNAGRPLNGLTGNVAVSFSSATTVTILGSIHRLGTAALLVAVQSAAVPAVQLAPAQVTVHPTTYDVTLTFAQPQSGTVVLNGASARTTPLANVSVPFSAATLVSISGGTHGLATARILVEVYNAASPAARIQPARITVHPTTYDVAVTFAQSQSGTVVLNGSVQVQVLAATVAARSQTPGAMSLLGVVRSLVARATGTSQTRSASAPLVHLFTAQAAGATRTPASSAGLARHLTAASGATTRTPASASTLTTVRHLLATAASSTRTPTASATSTRRVQALAPGTTTSPTVALQTLRPLVATARSTSRTPTALGTRILGLQALLAAVSRTPIVTVLTTLRRLTARLSGQAITTTPLATMGVLRSLVAQSRGQAITAAPGVQQGRHFSAEVRSTGQTAAPLLTTARVLSATLRAATLTTQPFMILLALRALSSRLSGTTTTRAGSSTQGRHLLTQLLGTSRTPLVTQVPILWHALATARGTTQTRAAVPQMGVLRSLVATAQAGSTTTAPAVRTTRTLQSALAGHCETPGSTSTAQRRVQARVQGASQTPPASPTIAALRFLQAQAAGRSGTPAATDLLRRGLLAVPAGRTQTTGAVPTLARSLTAGVAGTSASGATILGTLVQFTATAAGRSSTPALPQPVMERILICDIWGQVTTSKPITFSTQRWSVTLTATSRIDDPELQPFSGTVQLRAGVQGRSLTSQAETFTLPTRRIFTVVPPGRVFRVTTTV